MPPAGGLAQIAAEFEVGQRKLLALVVPDIAEVRAQYESAKRVMVLQIASARDMETALGLDSQISFADAYTGFLEANQQAEEVHRDIESLMSKYKITDSEVDYRFRGKQ